MTKSTAALVFIAVVACSHLGFAEQLAPVTEFTLRDYPVDGVVDQLYSGSDGMVGWIQKSDMLLDETFIEFDLDSLTPGCKATLEMRLYSPPGNGALVSRTFEVSTYRGSGIPDLSRFGTGRYFTTLTMAAPPSHYQAAMQTFVCDVTSEVSYASDCGNQFLGFRLHNPADVAPGSDHAPFVGYIGGSAILSSVPEPSSLVLFGTSVISVLVCVVRRHSSVGQTRRA